jgi:hypothetical protein
MFAELANQVWTNSATGVTVTNNTDTSIDGSSKRMVFTAVGATVTVSFDSIDLSDYEELSMHFYLRDTLYDDIFTVTIGSNTYTFSRREFRRNLWNHILFDCSNYMTPVTSIVITSLVPDLTLFIDYIGYRRVTYNCDIDIITSLKAHINLDYDVSTTLTAAAAAGTYEVSLDRSGIADYVTDHSVIEIDNGAGTTEIVTLIDKDGNLLEPLTNSFASGSTVEILCPVESEDYDDVQADPVCGIKVVDMKIDRQRTVMVAKNRSLVKEYLGALGIVIYIDCSSKKKLLQLSREYNKKYGKEFQFLLDGEQVEIYMESSVFTEDVIGNNPRVAYYYKLEPQPYMMVQSPEMTSITLTVDSAASDDVSTN